MIKRLFLLLFWMCMSTVHASPSHIDWDFPSDYGPHPAFNTEWWYFTGHLTDGDKNLYGFQVTFFRYGLKTVDNSKSPFNAPHLYTAHFALTDSKNNKFYHDEAYGRQSLGLVKSPPNTLDLQVKDWKLSHNGQTFEINLATTKGTLQLSLSPTKKRIFHGDKGISFKSADKQSFSHYYSHTRLKGTGSFQSPEGRLSFTEASAWMDREIFNTLLTSEKTGWYWFAIQLDNNSEVMLFSVNSDGESYYSGTLIDKDGNTTPIAPSDISISPEAFWKSPESGNRYATQWTISILENATVGYPAFTYTVDAVMQNQELQVKYPFTLFYWEGQSLVTGTHTGKAYVEIVPLR